METEDDEEEEKITRYWSVLKSTPQLHKSKVPLNTKAPINFIIFAS